MRIFFFAIFMGLLSVAGVAQTIGAASLIADSVSFDAGNQTLTARGNVEIINDGVTLRANSISYNGLNDQLSVTGPIYLLGDDGSIIVAEFAQLSGDLQAGVLSGARLVYDRQLQLAATEIRRTNGRYTQFYKTVASSCKICDSNPIPTWEIRAKRVVHDDEEQQLYFNNAILRVMGVPVFYTPYLRLPDPAVERSTGFLIPEFETSGDLGLGIKIPYFITLGDHADVTFTPWFTDRDSTTLETRYRQKFRTGEIEINSAVTDDELTDENLRGYIFADGSFALPREFNLRFDIETVTDPGYLLLYDYSTKDRLDSAITIDRAERDEYISTGLIHYRSLRTGDDNRTLPTVIVDAVYQRRFEPVIIGGIAGIKLDTQGSYRRADVDLTNSGLARDVIRLSGTADWRRDWIMSNGMIFAGLSELRADLYQVQQDNRLAFDDTTEITPYAALEWRWPMLKYGANASHLLEPTIQMVWSDESTRDVDNEDSLLVEFDEGNLFEFSRFSGVDAQEKGARLNLGVSYLREDPDGWSLGMTVGKIIRESDLGQFGASTGLQGQTSDWLLATQLNIGENFSLINRAILDDGFSTARDELRLNWTADKYKMGTGFVWLEADPDEGRFIDTSELNFDGSYRVSRHWTLSSDLRYDFVQDQTINAGLGATYRNECAQIDLYATRRFTSSSTLTPTTKFSLSFQLGGFGANGIGGESYARRCN